MEAVLTTHEKMSKALKEIKNVVSLWARGKITHESAMFQVLAIAKKVH